MKLILKQEATGVLKEAKVGFSWTTLFFGFLPALFRGDWKWALIMLVAAFVTFSLSCLVFPFFYNKVYIKELLQKGFIPTDDANASILRDKGILAA